MATHLIANCLILHPILPFTFPPHSRTILPQLPTQPCIDLSQSLVTVWNGALILCLPRAFPRHTVCSTPSGNPRGVVVPLGGAMCGNKKPDAPQAGPTEVT